MLSSTLFAATRRRLVLWNIAVTGVIIAAFALAAYVTASHVLGGELDQQLAARASEMQAYVSHDPTFAPTDDHDFPDTPDVFFLVLSPAGTVLQNSLNVQLSGLPDLTALRDTLANGKPDLRTVQVSSKGRQIEVRLRTEPIISVSDGSLLGVLQLGISTQWYNHELEELLLVLALVGAGGLVLALGGGFFLASRALVPVRTAFQRQRDFVGDASHELRTPLMLIRADIDVLGREVRAIRARLPGITIAALPSGEAPTLGALMLGAAEEKPGVVDAGQLDDQLELVDDALGEIDRMTRLLKDLLLLARLDAGAVKAAHQPVALTEQLEGLIDQVRRRAETQGLTVHARLEPGIQVVGNADQLRQLWLILLDNAIRYNRPAGSITITGVVEDHHASVSVTDTGIGIAPADLPRLFERFYRADKAHSRASSSEKEMDTASPQESVAASSDGVGSGAGLGLAIAQEIAQEHGSQISVKSTPGEGTTFTVRLQLAE